MDPQLANLILAQLKAHETKLESIAADVLIIKTTMKQGDYEARLKHVEATDWYIRSGCKFMGVIVSAALLMHQLGLL